MADLDKPLSGRVAVVTGAGSGLGRAYALALAHNGASVVVNDLPSAEQAADEVVATIAAAGATATTALVSAADPSSGAEIVDRALGEFGRLDIAVSNAGVLRSALFPNVSDEDWDLHRSVHLDGAFRLVRAAWPTMVEQGFGRIVLTTSAGGLFGAHGLSAYGAAKLGVAGLLRVLAVEAADTGIRVNAVAPLAWTPMSKAGGRTGSTAQILGPETFEQYLPEYVAEVVMLLSHPDCPAQGQILTAGGGRVAEVTVAETRGYTGKPLGWREILDQWENICDRTDMAFPRSMSEELTAFAEGATGTDLPATAR
jgi:NAD(P)-dependent dehydrogenase (short-subunit alcohol dehydrogenase family)